MSTKCLKTGCTEAESVPPNHRSGPHESRKLFFVKKSKIEVFSRAKLPSLSASPDTPEKTRNSFSKSPSNFAVLGFFSNIAYAHLGRVRDPPNHRSGPHESRKIFFVKKSKIEVFSRANSIPFRLRPTLPKKLEIPLVNCPVILWL